jgi:copper oxidase (laccase) domain-containing protein
METATLPRLDAPFRWEGEHVAADLPGARALFTTRRGGVSEGPFESLNLGRKTADDGANVDENRARVAAATGCARERFLYGIQEHGTTVRRATEPPGPDRPPADAAALREVGGSGPVTALIGPGARACCYEVGDEVHAAFAGYDARRGQNLDLPAVIRAQLAEAGVHDVHDTGLCTMCWFGLFFSHRRDGGVTGRQAGIVWRA